MGESQVNKRRKIETQGAESCNTNVDPKGNGALSGSVFCVTGTLSLGSRTVVLELIDLLGGNTRQQVSVR